MDKTKLGIGIFVSLALFIGGYYVSPDDQAFYCVSRDIVAVCDSLSSGSGTRCYFDESYKMCSEGWSPITDFIESDSVISEVEVFANNQWYTCSISDGVLNSYSYCVSGEELAYMGELI